MMNSVQYLIKSLALEEIKYLLEQDRNRCIVSHHEPLMLSYYVVDKKEANTHGGKEKEINQIVILSY